VTALELKLLALIHHGRDRCGAGFGKYPLGIRYAVGELQPLLDDPDHPVIVEAVADFDRRLER
jgi:hypothetical protein